MVWFIFALLLGDPIEENRMTITSEDLEMLYRNYWGKWAFHEETWYLVAPEIKKSQVKVWRWPRDGRLELWAVSGLREGMIANSGIAIDAKNSRLAIRCLTTGRIFTLALDQDDPQFKRIGHANDLSGDMGFWEGSKLIGGAEPFAIKGYSEEDNPEFLTNLNALLPDDAEHPSQRAENTHQIKLAINGNKLAVGYTLYPKVFMFHIGNSVTREMIPLRFRGYIQPPKTYIKNYSHKASSEYFATFHQLTTLSWFKDDIYGHFKKGFGTHGLWVNLISPADFFWDNDKQKVKILAMQKGECIMGEMVEQENGVIRWSLWRSSSLPLH